MISPHQAAVPRHHFKKKPYCRERRRNKNKNKTLCFAVTNQEKVTGSFQRKKYSGTANLPVVSATSLLCEAARPPSSAFPFLANLRCEGPASSPQNWAWGRLCKWSDWKCLQTRAPPKITAVPAHPARPRLSGPPSCAVVPAPRGLSCLRPVPSRQLPSGLKS